MKKLRDLREDNDLTQEQVAYLLGTPRQCMQGMSAEQATFRCAIWKCFAGSIMFLRMKSLKSNLMIPAQKGRQRSQNK